jgi:hypothetical protein
LPQREPGTGNRKKLSECKPAINENSIVLGGIVEGAIEVVGPSEELQIVGVRNANPGAGGFEGASCQDRRAGAGERFI